MTNSLRDQLLGLGFKAPPKPERREAPRDHAKHKPKDAGRSGTSRSGQPQKRDAAPQRQEHGARPARRKARAGHDGEMDLARAYAIRAQKEKDERIAAERARQEEAQRRREGKAKLAELLKSASLNDAAAEIARHFEYGGKIRRIYVTPDQLRALNGGELAVVQLAGRYHLVTPLHADEAESMMPGALALRVDPATGEGGEEYADSRFQVPDDLVW